MNRILLLNIVFFVLLQASPNLPAREIDTLLPSRGPCVRELTVKVAGELGDTVVSVKTKTTRRVEVAPRAFGQRDNLTRHFFEDFFQALPDREVERRGLGSGVIIDPDGYILTNRHVINDAHEITVGLSDGRRFEALLKGSDPRSDLAVLKIEAEDLPFASLGDSEDLRLGEWVMAIGNPFGFVITGAQPTVTVGVVSALDRAIPDLSGQQRSFRGLIQTDAAINPGNSGGPLVNLDGKVVGINNAIITTTGGYQGMGFAIPVNRVKEVLGSLMLGEEILYGWLGVGVQQLTEPLIEYLGIEKEKGIFILEVVQGSPADNIGLREKDVIVSVDGKTVYDVYAFSDKISSSRPGSILSIEILRQGNLKKKEVEIGSYPREETITLSRYDAVTLRGLTVVSLTEDIILENNIPVGEGVMVVKVEKGSPASRAGLTKGDVITHIEGESVSNQEEFFEIIGRNRGKCLLRTLRGFVVLDGE